MSRPTSRDLDLESCQLSEALHEVGDLRSHYDLGRQPSAISNFSLFGRPPLSHKGSLVFPRTPIVVTDLTRTQDRMSAQDVDESIYHWKILNLSRAKLKASSRTSALLSGFAMVAMVEIQIDHEIPPGLLIAFAVCTVLLIAVHMLALMISTCILPNVEAISNLHYQTPKTVFESPHTKMTIIIELAWAFSTVLGIILFLVEIALLCWVKFFSYSHATAWVTTALLIPIICIFLAFAAHFYLKLVGHKSEVHEHNIRELEMLKDQLDSDNGAAGDNHSQSGLNIV